MKNGKTPCLESFSINCILTLFFVGFVLVEAGIWKRTQLAGWKPALRSAAILAAGSGGFQPSVAKNNFKMGHLPFSVSAFTLRLRVFALMLQE
jgi:hypothetical protein